LSASEIRERHCHMDRGPDFAALNPGGEAGVSEALMGGQNG
jgi:hypothetical protein